MGNLGYLYGLCPGNTQKRLVRIHRRVSPWMTSRQLRIRAALVMKSYARYWWDVFWLSHPQRAGSIDRLVSTEGFDRTIATIDEARSRDVGVIFVLPHVGSWEIGGAWVSSRGYPPVVVAERLQPPELFELFTRTRASVGVTVVAHDDHPTAKLLAALKDKKAICLVADRDMSRRGILIDFFGAPKTFPVGPAALSLKTSAPIIPVCTYASHDGKITISFGEPILASDKDNKEDQILDIMTSVVRQFEIMIERDPTQWHVLHDEWERT